MNKVNLSIIVISTLIILGVINYSIWQKEAHLANGEIIYLELAPVDPRSIMQGDYMTLTFKISRQIRSAILGQSMQPETEDEQNWLDFSSPYYMHPQDGFVIVDIDENKRAEFSSLDDGMHTLSSKQQKLQFRVREGQIKFATNAFFFEEGDALLFDTAKYGELKVNEHGEVLLTGLLDENLKKLGGEKYD